MKYCVPCDAPRITFGNYCGDCGSELEERWATICIKCSHKSNTATRFCTFCGSSLQMPVAVLPRG
jgi:hypothetical protein